MENENGLRYTHFVNQIVSQKTVWLLKAQDGMYAMFEDTNDRAYLPVWADKDEAEKLSVDDWGDYAPEAMELYEFINWMQELKEDEILIGACPDKDLISMAVDPIELKTNVLAVLKS